MARRYIVTRPLDHAAALSDALRAIGIEPIGVPAVTIAPPASWEPLDHALRHLTEFDWVLLTSRSGVEAFFGHAGPHFSWPESLRWAAIGPGTAAALRGRGIRDVWIPSHFLSDAIAEEMPAVRGERVLRLRAEQASETPTKGLRARGIGVTDVIVYRTLEAPPASRERLAQAWARGVEGVIFTSASTVRGFLRLAADTDLRAEVGAVRLVAIGPVTAEALRAAGLVPHAVAAEHSVRGLIHILVERSDEHATRVHEA